MKFVRAAPIRSVDDCAARTPEFCAVGVRLHFEFGNRVRRNLYDLARKTLVAGPVSVVVHAVQQKIVHRRPQAIDVKSGLASAAAD